VLADAKPGVVVTGEVHLLAFVGLHCCVDGQWLKGVDLGGRDCANDPGWTDDVPVCFWVFFAECKEFVFLRIVEVWFEGIARVLGLMLAAIASKVVLGVDLQIRRMVFSLGLGVPVDRQSLEFESSQAKSYIVVFCSGL